MIILYFQVFEENCRLLDMAYIQLLEHSSDEALETEYESCVFR